MSSDYPLFPELPEGGAEEAQVLINKFKESLSKAADEAIGDLYCDIVPHIESDSWTNYRNFLMNGLRNYNNRTIQSPYDFKEIRQAIYKEFREDIIGDLNQDMVKEIANLKEQLEFIERCRSNL
ncbi:MAG: hypothetical protein ABUJ92_00670 [Desulfobacterales bacterium]